MAIFQRACLEAVVLSNLSVLIVTSTWAGQVSTNSAPILSLLLTELSCTHPLGHCFHAFFNTLFARLRGSTVDAAHWIVIVNKHTRIALIVVEDQAYGRVVCAIARIFIFLEVFRVFLWFGLELSFVLVHILVLLVISFFIDGGICRDHAKSFSFLLLLTAVRLYYVVGVY